MVTNDYLFAVLLMVCVWWFVYSGHGHLGH